MQTGASVFQQGVEQTRLVAVDVGVVVERADLDGDDGERLDQDELVVVVAHAAACRARRRRFFARRLHVREQ
jgi:hypothetical protein